LAILQRSLDVLDIEGLSNLWVLSHIQPPSESPALCPPPIGLTAPDPTISEWTNFVDQYLSAHNTLDHAHPEISNLRYYLLAYLLSATFKDCSIMLRINPSDSNASSDAEINSVTLIDLDPKSIDRMTKWEKLDREIVESYNGTEEKHCVDGWMDNMLQRPKTCSQT
jgi:inositol-pentakisphosphate 2-kinase